MRGLIIFLICSCSLLAEDLYIAQTATGGGTGANCANALAITFFNTAGNWASGAGKISPGDTVHACGTFTSQALFQGDGTAGNPITLLFEAGAKWSAPTWGGGATGLAIGVALGGATRSYLTIDGGSNGLIECTDNGSSPTYTNHDDTSAIFFPSCSNCIIKNVTVSNIYVKTDTGSQGGGDAVHIQAGSGIQIYGMTIHDSSTCLAVDFVAGSAISVEIRNNVIYHCNWGIKVATSALTVGTLTGLSIHDNEVYDAVNWDDLSSNAFHHNYIIFFISNADSLIVDPLIYNNYFHGDPGVHMTSNIFLDPNNGSMATAKVFNNVFYNVSAAGNAPSNGLGDPGCATPGCAAGEASEWYNNVFWYETNVGGRCLQTGDQTNVIAKNNVFINCGTVLFDQGTATLDYNDFYGWTTFNGSITTFAAWKAATGGDAHSITTNPSLSSSTFIPTGGSGVIGTALNLTSLGITALNSDKAGVARGSFWDIGALQAGAATTSGISIGGAFTGGGRLTLH